MRVRGEKAGVVKRRAGSVECGHMRENTVTRKDRHPRESGDHVKMEIIFIGFPLTRE